MFNLKSAKASLLTIFILTIFVSSGMLLIGCSSEKKTEEGASDQSGLPQDAGNKSLLDTTTTTTQPTTPPSQGEVAQKPAAKEEAKPKPKTPTETKPTQPQVTKTLLLAENSALEVSLLTELSTGANKVGDKFRALIKGSATEGQTLDLPDGTLLEGQIAEINDGKAKGEKAFIKLGFTTLLLPGQDPIPIQGSLITDDGSGIIRPGDQGTTIAKDAAVGAAAGGVVGAVTGGKTKDAAKGAVVGAVAGGVLGAVLHKDQVTLKEGRVLKVNIATPVYQAKEVKGL